MPKFKDEKTKQLYERLWQLSSCGGEAPLPSRDQMAASMSYMKGVLQCVAVCCSGGEAPVPSRDQMAASMSYMKAVLQCVAVCCSVLQCVAAAARHLFPPCS